MRKIGWILIGWFSVLLIAGLILIFTVKTKNNPSGPGPGPGHECIPGVTACPAGENCVDGKCITNACGGPCPATQFCNDGFCTQCSCKGLECSKVTLPYLECGTATTCEVGEKDGCLKQFNPIDSEAIKHIVPFICLKSDDSTQCFNSKILTANLTELNNRLGSYSELSQVFNTFKLTNGYIVSIIDNTSMNFDKEKIKAGFFKLCGFVTDIFNTGFDNIGVFVYDYDADPNSKTPFQGHMYLASYAYTYKDATSPTYIQGKRPTPQPNITNPKITSTFKHSLSVDLINTTSIYYPGALYSSGGAPGSTCMADTSSTEKLPSPNEPGVYLIGNPATMETLGLCTPAPADKTCGEGNYFNQLIGKCICKSCVESVGCESSLAPRKESQINNLGWWPAGKSCPPVCEWQPKKDPGSSCSPGLISASDSAEPGSNALNYGDLIRLNSYEAITSHKGGYLDIYGSADTTNNGYPTYTITDPNGGAAFWKILNEPDDELSTGPVMSGDIIYLQNGKDSAQLLWCDIDSKYTKKGSCGYGVRTVDRAKNTQDYSKWIIGLAKSPTTTGVPIHINDYIIIYNNEASADQHGTYNKKTQVYTGWGLQTCDNYSPTQYLISVGNANVSESNLIPFGWQVSRYYASNNWSDWDALPSGCCPMHLACLGRGTQKRYRHLAKVTWEHSSQEDTCKILGNDTTISWPPSPPLPGPTPTPILPPDTSDINLSDPKYIPYLGYYQEDGNYVSNPDIYDTDTRPCGVSIDVCGTQDQGGENVSPSGSTGASCKKAGLYWNVAPFPSTGAKGGGGTAVIYDPFCSMCHSGKTSYVPGEAVAAYNESGTSNNISKVNTGTACWVGDCVNEWCHEDLDYREDSSGNYEPSSNELGCLTVPPSGGNIGELGPSQSACWAYYDCKGCTNKFDCCQARCASTICDPTTCRSNAATENETWFKCIGDDPCTEVQPPGPGYNGDGTGPSPGYYTIYGGPGENNMLGSPGPAGYPYDPTANAQGTKKCNEYGTGLPKNPV